MFAVINAAATAYDGVIPPDRYHVPYMPAEELREEIASGVRFWGWYVGGGGAVAEEGRRVEDLWGLMGIQDVDDVTLIRHAYVLPERQVETSVVLRHVASTVRPLGAPAFPD